MVKIKKSFRNRYPIPFILLVTGCISVQHNLLILLLNPKLIYGSMIYFAFVIGIITLTIWLTIYGPPQNRYLKEEWTNPKNKINPPIDSTQWNIILDTHSHTKAMDGHLRLDQSVYYHYAMGFNAMVLTEHNMICNSKIVKRAQVKFLNKMVIIPGLEWTTSRIHLCFIGINEWKQSIPNTPTDEQIKQTIQFVHNKGGVVVVCHIPWSTGGPMPRIQNHPSRKQIMEWGVDFFEVANWGDEVENFDTASHEFVRENPGVGACVGTDIHIPERTKICGWTVLKTKDFTIASVLEELRNHRTSVALLAHALPYSIYHAPNPLFQILRPFIMIGNMFRSLNTGATIYDVDVNAIIAWVIVFFLGYWSLLIFSFLGFLSFNL